MEVINEIFWTNRANVDLNKIFEFLKEETSTEGASKRVIELVDFVEVSLLKKLDVASKDQQFSHLRDDFKKLLFRNYKITFKSKKDVAYILRIFDTRQHPDKNM